ncbi:MAG TPA: tetratricopeptide repeat protein [Polyangiaceae bacterium]|jgi:hypothetical protein
MKRKFEALRENLDEFVTQNDYPVLAVGCLPAELAYVVKFLQALDEKHPADYFVVFPQPFDTAEGYLDAATRDLQVQLQAAGEARAQRGDPPFAPLPNDVVDRRRPPEQRVHALLDWMRGLVPNEQEHRVVVGFLPLECRDVGAYARLMESFIPPKGFPQWMQALRVVVWDDRVDRRLGSDIRARKVERVLTFDVDFSTPALTDALSVDAVDTSLPVAERMACVLQLAALDYSYKRYPEALAKYGILFRYYEGVGLAPMQSLCLIGAGDTLRASGKPAEAKEMLQRALALSASAKSLPMLLNALISIVEVCFDLGHHEDAESYADSGAQVAAGALNPFPYADFYERKGDAQSAQKKQDEALASYGKCRNLARMYGYTHRAESVLGKLVQIYGERGMASEQRDAARELAEVHKAPVPGTPAGPSAAAGEAVGT